MELKEQVRNDPYFLSRVVTGDESWIYGYDPETKQQSSQWKHPSSPRPKKVRQVKSNVKSMLICFFDTDGITCKESVPPGQTINAKFYCSGLRWLMIRKQTDMAHKQLGVPSRQCACAHRFGCAAVLGLQKHDGHPPPPYSPDLTPCDFFLFPKMKINLKG
jgi:histone-lysine N-methyltransferase SETMAR